MQSSPALESLSNEVEYVFLEERGLEEKRNVSNKRRTYIVQLELEKSIQRIEREIAVKCAEYKNDISRSELWWGNKVDFPLRNIGLVIGKRYYN